jgi:hypothetical protein
VATPEEDRADGADGTDEVEAPVAGTASETVPAGRERAGIPEQQSAGRTADEEAGEGART